MEHQFINQQFGMEYILLRLNIPVVVALLKKQSLQIQQPNPNNITHKIIMTELQQQKYLEVLVAKEEAGLAAQFFVQQMESSPILLWWYKITNADIYKGYLQAKKDIKELLT